MNRTLNKNKGKTTKPKEEVIDATGKTGGIYDWYAWLLIPMISVGMLLNSGIVI